MDLDCLSSHTYTHYANSDFKVFGKNGLSSLRSTRRRDDKLLRISQKGSIFKSIRSRVYGEDSEAEQALSRLPFARISSWEMERSFSRHNTSSSSLCRGEMLENGAKNASLEGSNTLEADQTEAPQTSTTLFPGFIYPSVKTVGKSTNIAWQSCMVKREERQRLLGQKGCVIWMTGLSGSGKSTLACTLDHQLHKRGNLSYVLDGDNLRHGLNKNLGFSAEDRAENIRRIGEVAKTFVDAGVICIASAISPYRKDRDACRQLVQPGEFIEVYMNFPLSLCEKRDPKGLYKLARAGKIKGFTGIDDPYEAPLNCEVVMELIEGQCPTPADMAANLLSYLEQKGFLGPPRH